MMMPLLHEIYEMFYQFALLCHQMVRHNKKGKYNGTFNSAQFLEFHFKDCSPSIAHYRRSGADIKDVAKLWCDNGEEAERNHGHISDWDTSAVNMEKLFTSSLTTMEYILNDGSAFIQDIGGWDTLICLLIYGQK